MGILAHSSDSKLRAWQVLRSLAIAAFSVLVAMLATYPIKQIISYPFSFLFYGAVMLSAWFGGIVAGLFAILLSVLLINYFLIPPFDTFSSSYKEQIYLLAFAACSIVVIIVSESRKRAERAIRQANDQLESMVQVRTAELEHSNQEILERERHLLELTEAIPQQIWRLSPTREVEHLNLPLRHYLGEETCSDLSRFFESVLHADDTQLFDAAWAAAVLAEDRFEVEARIRRNDGQYRWFLIRGNPQRASNGSIVCWYGTHIDIEEQHRAQQALVTAQEDLLRLGKTLTLAEMAASIAHELNQPLTAVVTHAYACREWLRPESLNLEKASTTAEKIVQESTRASDVVRRVRALFQKEAPASQPADINQLIAGLMRLIRDEAIRRNVSFHLDLDNDLPALDMDPVLIQQVLLNLATNAMEALVQARQPRQVRFHTALDRSGEVVVTVHDTGPGVPQDIASRIFEPFFSTKPAGTGMGLAICRSIIEAHGGRLVATNAPDGGAIFQFTLRAIL